MERISAPIAKQRADYKSGLVKVKARRYHGVSEARTQGRYAGRTGRPAHCVRWEQEARVRLSQAAARVGIEGIDFLGRTLTWKQVFCRALYVGVPASEMLSRNLRA